MLGPSDADTSIDGSTLGFQDREGRFEALSLGFIDIDGLMDGITLTLGSLLGPKDLDGAGVLVGPVLVLGCNEGSNETVGR